MVKNAEILFRNLIRGLLEKNFFEYDYSCFFGWIGVHSRDKDIIEQVYYH